MRIAFKVCAISLALGAISSDAVAAGLSHDEMAAYMAQLQNSEKLSVEVDHWFHKLPLLSAYYMALFSERPCNFPHPSERLRTASHADAFAQTSAGQMVFITMGIAATEKYPTTAAKNRFCQSAKTLIDLAVSKVSKSK